MNEYHFTTGEEEIMLRHPNGRVEFMSLTEALRFASRLIWDYKAGNKVYLDGELINDR